MLLERGADPNLKTPPPGMTPLHMAVPNWELAEVLLEFGANPVAKNDGGKTPMDIARTCVARKVKGWEKYKRFAEKLEEHPAYRQVVMLQSLKEL
jgi:hypothetical protein